MLGHTYRFVAYNSSGVNASIIIKARNYKFGSDGQRVDAAESTPLSTGAIANLANGLGASIDNSYDKFLGSDVKVTITPAAAATGTVSVFLQKSTDGGVTWPETPTTGGAISGIWVASATFAASAVAQNPGGTIV